MVTRLCRGRGAHKACLQWAEQLPEGGPFHLGLDEGVEVWLEKNVEGLECAKAWRCVYRWRERCCVVWTLDLGRSGIPLCPLPPTPRGIHLKQLFILNLKPNTAATRVPGRRAAGRVGRERDQHAPPFGRRPRCGPPGQTQAEGYPAFQCVVSKIV